MYAFITQYNSMSTYRSFSWTNLENTSRLTSGAVDAAPAVTFRCIVGQPRP